MRILHLIPAYIPAYRYGGPVKSVHELNRWLVKKGLEVTVYTTNVDGPYKLKTPSSQEVAIDGVKVYYFPINFRPWAYSWKMHAALAKNIVHFDIVHITSVFLSVSTLGAYYAKKLRKPYVISPRGSLMIEPLRQRSPLRKKLYLNLLEKKNLAGATIHFTSDKERDEYIQVGLPRKLDTIIPNGLESKEFEGGAPLRDFRKNFKIEPSRKIILFLSRISWKKGLDTLVPAFAEVRATNPNTTLVIAGGDDEGYRKEIENRITKNGLQLGKDVVFTGMLVGEDKIAAYKNSKVFVLPSYAENFGQVVVEAMHSGLPVVITRGVGLSPVVSKSKAGLVVEKDKKQLAEAILKILDNPQLSKEMGERGKRLVATEFSWRKIAEKWINEYNKMTHG